MLIWSLIVIKTGCLDEYEMEFALPSQIQQDAAQSALLRLSKAR